LNIYGYSCALLQYAERDSGKNQMQQPHVPHAAMRRRRIERSDKKKYGESSSKNVFVACPFDAIVFVIARVRNDLCLAYRVH
jgi:hypothetical protein